MSVGIRFLPGGERIPEIVAGYSPSDVWNIDETGCFRHALPGKASEEKVRSVRVGKTQSTGQRLPSSSMQLVKVNVCPL